MVRGVIRTPEAIVRRAKGAGVTIYVVVLGPYALPMLREIAEETGGLYIDMYQRYDQLENVARVVMGHAKSLAPCRVSWLATADCSVDPKGAASRTSSWILGETFYEVPERTVQELKISTSGVRFGEVPEGGDSTIQILLTAHHGPINLFGYSSSRSSITIPQFDVSGVLPIMLGAGDTLAVDVAYHSGSVADENGKIAFETDACDPDSIFVGVGMPTDRGELPEITLLRPNGGEVFLAGSTEEYHLDGGDPSLPIQVRTSINNGVQWIPSDTIDYRAALPVQLPAFESDSCLAEVAQDMIVDESWLIPHPAAILEIDFDRDGGVVATSATDQFVRIWDINSGAMVDSLDVQNLIGPFSTIAGSDAIAVSSLSSIVVVDPRSGWATSLPTLSPTDPSVRAAVTLSTKDRRIVAHPFLPVLYGVQLTADSNGGPLPVLFRYSIPEEEYVPLDTLNCFPRTIDLSPDGQTMVFGGVEGCLEVRRLSFSATSIVEQEAFGDIVEVSFDHSGALIAILSRNELTSRYSLSIRRSADGSTLYQYPTIAPLVRSIDFSSSSTGILLGERQPSIRDIFSGAIRKELARGVRGDGLARSDGNGRYYATATGDSALQLWQLDQPHRIADRSDSLWRLVAPDLQLLPVDFGRVPVQTRRDTLVRRTHTKRRDLSANSR